MATATVEINTIPTGLTLTLSLFPLGSDTASFSGLTLTERTNSKSTYRTTCSAPTEGWYIALTLQGATPIHNGFVYLKNEADTFFVDDPKNFLQVARASAELTAVPAALTDFYSMIQMLYMSTRNQKTGTASAQTISNDAGTVIGTATVTDNGTTTTIGKMS